MKDNYFKFIMKTFIYLFIKTRFGPLFLKFSTI